MTVKSFHPLYDAFAPYWSQMRDSQAGQAVIKTRTTKYLPATAGMIVDGAAANAMSAGALRYQAYLLRAFFPDLVNLAVTGIHGLLHRKPAKIELPPELEPMRENATSDGESLQALLARINWEQLVLGRIGLHLEAPDGGGPDALPFFVTYCGESIINWDSVRTSTGDVTNLIILDESGAVRREDFTWEDIEQYRVLSLGDPNGEPGAYQTSLADKGSSFEIDTENQTVPSIAGRTLDEIPFVFINSKDLVSEPEKPPLLGLSNQVLVIYRGEADYRQSLYMQGEETLVIVDGYALGDGEVRTGTGAMISVQQGGDAKYIGTSSEGIPEQREALVNDYARAASEGARMFENGGRHVESGDALRIRVAGKTSSMTSISISGAAGLETGLKQAAKWIGADPSKVKVSSNQDFADDAVEGKTLVDIQTFKHLGGPIALDSIHRILRQRDLTDMTFEEELAAIAEEAPTVSFGSEGKTE